MTRLIAQNAIVFRDMYLQFSARHNNLHGWDWPTNLALGIHESLGRFQLLSIKGLINGGPHSSQSFLQIRLQRYLYLT